MAAKRLGQQQVPACMVIDQLDDNTGRTILNVSLFDFFLCSVVEVMLGLSVILATLFLGRLNSSRLSSFRHSPTTSERMCGTQDLTCELPNARLNVLPITPTILNGIILMV